MAAGTFDFPCEHCGRELRTTSDAIGRRVTCPGCRQKTVAQVADEPPPAPRSSRSSRPRRPAAAFPWMWVAGGGAIVLLVAGIGVAFAAVMLSTSRREKPAATPVATTSTAKHQETPPGPPPGPPPDTTMVSGTTGPAATPVGTPPPPPPKVADWKLTAPVVRTGTRVLGNFNQVLTAELGYDMVEVFADVDCPGPARSEGFDAFGVTLTVRGSAPGADPVRRAALGFTLADDGPEKTSYFVPAAVTMGKAGDSVDLSRGKETAVTIFPRVTGDQTGPCRVAPKQNPTRLGFAFSVPKGSVPIELRVGDATLALGAPQSPPIGDGPAAGTSAPAGDLPGARGKQFEKVGSLPPGVEFAEVYMTDKAFAPAPKPLPQTFPSGTKTLDVVVALKRRPPGGTSVWREVRGKDGVVKLKGFVMMTAENNATGHFEIPLECAPTSGSYPDGDYQTRVLVNDKVVGVLNWSVGGKK